MTRELTIYIAPPLSEKGRWRVRSDDLPIKEFGSERESIAFAARHAQSVEADGGSVIIKVERPDGSWETFRV